MTCSLADTNDWVCSSIAALTGASQSSLHITSQTAQPTPRQPACSTCWQCGLSLLQLLLLLLPCTNHLHKSNININTQWQHLPMSCMPLHKGWDMAWSKVGLFWSNMHWIHQWLIWMTVYSEPDKLILHPRLPFNPLKCSVSYSYI